MSIKHWPKQERPREKLLDLGARSLSDAELLAIFLGTGLAGGDAVSVARQCLEEAGGLARLLTLPRQDFLAFKGLGPVKYVVLQASLELSRRYLQSELATTSFFQSTETAKQFFRAHIGREPREVFAVAFLNSQYEMIGCETLFYGTIDGAQVYSREVVKAALLHNAAAVVLAHNHPSGSLLPSDADLRLTKQLRLALDVVDIRVLDHIIVGNGSVSLAELGHM